MRVYVTADLHLGHRKIIEYEPARMHYKSIEEHDKDIIERWRSVVTKHDVVYVLGDVAWNRKALEQVRCLPGIKKLVMGNHDRYDMRAYLAIFRKVSAYSVLDGCLLSHVPAHIGSVKPRYRGNAHGHLHGRGSPLGPYMSACLEMHDMTPVLWEEMKCLAIETGSLDIDPPDVTIDDRRTWKHC